MMADPQNQWQVASEKPAPAAGNTDWQVANEVPAPPSRVADSLQDATISPPESGIAASIDRFKNKVRDWMGADHKPAGDVMGGVILGPLNAAHGAAIAPSHPVRGAHEILNGIGQTIALPSAVINPATMAYAAPGIVAQKGVSSGLKNVGADDDYANLAGDMAGIATGIGVNSPRIMQSVKAIARPGMKITWEAAKDTPVIGGAIKGAASIKDVLPELRQIWAKPGETVTDDDTGIAAPEQPTTTPLKAKSPKAAQTEILRKAGVAAPAATIKPMTRVPTAEISPRADLSFAGSRSGDSAALNQLSENFSPDRLGINDLRGIAQSRGIKVAPADNHAVLIGKIHDSLTPEELDKFEQATQERMQPDYSLPTEIVSPPR